MTDPYRISLIGFTAYERTTLEAFFRLSARRSPRYEHASEPSEAHAVLVDADQASAMAQAELHMHKCVCVGTKAPSAALAHMARPLNMMVLLRLLDQLLALPAQTTPPVPTPAAPPLALPTSAPINTTPSLTERRGVPRASANELATSLLGVLPSATPKTQPATTQQPPRLAPVAELLSQSIVGSKPLVSRADHILVVDDSDVALRFMANCLSRFGFDVELAKSGEEALQRVAQEHFTFVFMDVNMPGIDGYQTCKMIKKRPYPDDRRAPTVVMLTSRGGMVDKLRGTMAGCDAYLTKPLQQTDLMTVIGERLSRSGDEQRLPVQPRLRTTG